MPFVAPAYMVAKATNLLVRYGSILLAASLSVIPSLCDFAPHCNAFDVVALSRPIGFDPWKIRNASSGTAVARIADARAGDLLAGPTTQSSVGLEVVL